MISGIYQIKLNSIKLYDSLKNDNISRQKANIYNKNLQTDTFNKTCFSKVSFGANFNITTFNNIPCPCCGNKMLTMNEVKEFSELISNSIGNTLIKNLEKYKIDMPEPEKEVVNLVQSAAKTYNKKSISEIIEYLASEDYAVEIHSQTPLERLKYKEKAVIKEMITIAQDLQGESGKIFKKKLKEICTIIDSGKDNKPFNRHVMFNSIRKTYHNEKNQNNKNILSKISAKATELPSSLTDIDAFIVKYSSKTSEEIASRLVLRRTATIDHVKSKFAGGEDKDYNYWVLCKLCNNEKASMSLSEFEKHHPEMIQNSQIHFDILVEKLKSGFDIDAEYLVKMKHVLKEQSKGKILINLPENIYDFRIKNSQRLPILKNTANTAQTNTGSLNRQKRSNNESSFLPQSKPTKKGKNFYDDPFIKSEINHYLKPNGQSLKGQVKSVLSKLGTPDYE